MIETSSLKLSSFRLLFHFQKRFSFNILNFRAQVIADGVGADRTEEADRASPLFAFDREVLQTRFYGPTVAPGLALG